MAIREISISNLKEHPLNEELFGEPGGRNWEELVESIRLSNGAIEPIVVSEDFTIISGHRRVKAHRELGLFNIIANVKVYGGDADEMAFDLVETNVRQRGSIGGTAEQIAKRLDIVRHWREKNGETRLTAAQIAVQAGATPAQANNATQVVKVMESYPEIKEARHEGRLTDSAILAVAKQDEEIQKKVVQSLDLSRRVAIKDVADTIDRVTGKYDERLQQEAAAIQAEVDAVKSELEAKVAEKDEQISHLKKRIEVQKSASKRQRQLDKASRIGERKRHITLDDFQPAEGQQYDLQCDIDQRTQDFAAFFEGVLADANFAEKFASFSREGRDTILNTCSRIRNIVDTIEETNRTCEISA